MIVLHKLHATVLTDQGKVRTNNEDNFYFDGKGYEEPQAFCHFSEKCSTRKKPIFAVFDGMGGVILWRNCFQLSSSNAPTT